MKLHLLSDVHLEAGAFPQASHPNTVAADVTVLAGDIGTGLMGLEWALTIERPVVYVMGNHEYWGPRHERTWGTLETLRAAAREKVAGTHVHLLENEAVVIEGVRFLGCTLWTDFALFGEQARIQIMNHCQEGMSDYRRITVDDGKGGTMLLMPRHTQAMHQASREFLVSELGKRGPWDKTVCVTHHAPSALSLAEGKAVWNQEAACASHLDHIVGLADLWCHGHTHIAVNYRVAGGGRVMSNPRGYVGYDELLCGDLALVLEV